MPKKKRKNGGGSKLEIHNKIATHQGGQGRNDAEF